MNYYKMVVYSRLKCCGEEMVEVEFLQCIWRGVWAASVWRFLRWLFRMVSFLSGKNRDTNAENCFSGKVRCRLPRLIFSTIKEKNHPFDFCFAENVVYLHTFYKIWYSIFY